VLRIAPGHRHEPRHPLDHLVKSRVILERTGEAETVHGCNDEPRVELFYSSSRESQLVECSQFEIFDEDVGVHDESFENLAAFWRVEVEADRPFVTVDGIEVQAVAVLEWRPAAGRVAALCALDLDDAGAHVREQRCAVRARERATEVDDDNPVERLYHHAADDATPLSARIHDSIRSVGIAGGSPVILSAMGGSPSLVGTRTTMFARS
jgi:hypothetical protein